MYTYKRYVSPSEAANPGPNINYFYKYSIRDNTKSSDIPLMFETKSDTISKQFKGEACQGC